MPAALCGACVIPSVCGRSPRLRPARSGQAKTAFESLILRDPAAAKKEYKDAKELELTRLPANGGGLLPSMLAAGGKVKALQRASFPGCAPLGPHSQSGRTPHSNSAVKAMPPATLSVRKAGGGVTRWGLRSQTMMHPSLIQHTLNPNTPTLHHQRSTTFSPLTAYSPCLTCKGLTTISMCCLYLHRCYSKSDCLGKIE